MVPGLDYHTISLLLLRSKITTLSLVEWELRIKDRRNNAKSAN